MKAILTSLFAVACLFSTQAFDAAAQTRNPFEGVQDIAAPFDSEAVKLRDTVIRNILAARPSDYRNRALNETGWDSAWQTGPDDGDMWISGPGAIRYRNGTYYLSYRDWDSPDPRWTYLIEARPLFVDRDGAASGLILWGNYVNLDSRATGAWTGIIRSASYIEGYWNADTDVIRPWDFSR